MTLPSQEYLQSRIYYNPQTGEVRWKPVDESFGRTWRTFNKVHAGKILIGTMRIQGKHTTVGQVIYKLLYGVEVPRVTYADGDSNNLESNNLLHVSKGICTSIKTATKYSYKKLPDLTSLLTYKHISGKFIWLPRDNKSFTNRYAGSEAGSKNTEGYVKIYVDCRSIAAHRLAWYFYYGVDPQDYVIDHIDKNTSNNCITNLRLATYSLNTQHSVTNAKGYTLRDNKYIANFTINKTSIHLGTYKTAEEAEAVYLSAVELYKPIYKFTQEEQAQLDQLYNSYPNCDPNLQTICHNIQVKALKHYVDAAIVQTPNL